MTSQAVLTTPDHKRAHNEQHYAGKNMK